MNEYIDVRGVYPIYFRGAQFIRLPFMNSTSWWTINKARYYFDNH